MGEKRILELDSLNGPRLLILVRPTLLRNLNLGVVSNHTHFSRKTLRCRIIPSKSPALVQRPNAETRPQTREG